MIVRGSGHEPAMSLAPSMRTLTGKGGGQEHFSMTKEEAKSERLKPNNDCFPFQRNLEAQSTTIVLLLSRKVVSYRFSVWSYDFLYMK